MKRNECIADGRWPMADRRPAIGSPRRPIPNTQSRFPNPRSASGSVLILVVVMLVLLALIGTAYMQRVRLDRTAARITPASHIDEVVAATLDQLRQVLKDDLVQGNNFLDADDGIEGYDYPWTNPAERRNGIARYHRGILTGNDRPLGGHLDDPWLASSYPDDVQFNPPAAATTFGWRHITNLNGIFLNLPAEDPANPAVRPYEHTTHQAVPGANHGLLDHTDAALRLFQGTDNFPALDAAPQYIGTLSSHEYQPRGHDVDGDGVLDARWTWAPIRTINGIDYVMAVRIIDNGAMLNVNAATALTTDGQDAFPPGILAPNALWPTALDFSRILQRVNAGYRPEATRNLLLRRRGTDASPTMVTPHFLDVTGGNVATIEPAAASYYFNVLLRYGQWTRDNRFFGPENEIALRFGNGVRSSRFGTPPVEWISDEAASPAAAAPAYTQGVGRMLRNRYGMASTTEELHYTRVINQTPGTTAAQKAAQVADFFHGVGNPSAPGYRLDDLRKWLTTHNGAAEILPLNFFATANPPLEVRHPSLPFRTFDGTTYTPLDPAGPNVARIFADPATDPVEVEQLAERIHQIFRVGNDGQPDAYLGLTRDNAADIDTLRRLAGVFAASIKDYWDNDYEPTEWEDPVTLDKFYGLERLPFLRQVYLQAAFSVDPVPVDPNDPFSPQDTDPDSGLPLWERTLIPDSEIIAIEMANPFTDAIDFKADLFDSERLRLVIRQGLSEWRYTIRNATAGNGYISAPDKLDPDQMMIVYNLVGSGYTGPSSSDNDLMQSLQDINQTDHVVPNPLPDAELPSLAFARPTYSLGAAVTVELRVRVDTTTWITYDRIEHTNLQINNWSGTTFDDASPPNMQHAQVSFARHTSDGGVPGPYYLSTRGQDFINAPTGLHFSDPPDNSYEANVGIGAAVKNLPPTPGPQPELENVQLMVANRPIVNPVELAMIGMIGFSDRPPPEDTFTDRVAGMLGMVTPAHHETVGGVNLGIPRVMFLDLSPDAAVPAVNGAAIPHAAMVLDLLSTISPQTDGLDNDGDGNIDAAGGPRELFVPGRINVNTAPLHLLTLAAPLPEAVGDIEDLMQSVINYRDNVDPATGNPWRPTQAHTNNPGNLTMLANYRQEPGVLSLAELLWMNPQDNTGNPADMQGYLGDTAALPTTPGSIDLNPLPTETSGSNPRTNSPVIDDAEERVARFQFLNQVFTTRSDVYTAYVEIRGYPAHDYRGGPVERTRFLVVLDRGRIASSDDDVRVIAMYRY